MTPPIDAKDYAYDLPEDRIRLYPPTRREDSRLAVVRRNVSISREVMFKTVSDLPEILRPGDRLVVNDSRVLPARVRAYNSRGGEIEILFLGPFTEGTSGSVRFLAKSVGRDYRLALFSGRGEVLISGYLEGEGCFGGEYRGERPLSEELEACGEMPLPPYIARKRHADAGDRERYQTVYSKIPGSVAAPTAGLHLGSDLLFRLSGAGIDLSFVTLHVGLGTFRPLNEGPVDAHRMHAEWFSVPSRTLGDISRTRSRGGRVVAVGTTALRALESAVLREAPDRTSGSDPESVSGWTDLFIRPGHQFGPVDGLFTNFHTPRSTLLVLVDAFLGGGGRWREIYGRALSEGLFFLSYGDALLIL